VAPWYGVAMSAAPRIRYQVRIPEPKTHLVAVEVTLPPADPLDVALAAWTPGSYLVREYARHVRDLGATQAGRRLEVRKLDKHTWRIEGASPTGPAVTVAYRVYAHELTVRTSDVDADHAFLHPASLFAYVPVLTGEPIAVDVEPLEGCAIATGLTLAPGAEAGSGHFLAADLDELLDCPIEIGGFEWLEFIAGGKPHYLAICGHGYFDRAQVVVDVKAFVDQASALFGGMPYESFTFIVHLAPGGQGGLEHRNSAAIQASPHVFHPRKSYDGFLELLCHEHFHVWNVKRIRPAPLGPFDYGRENYTRSLWVAEGITSYYDRLLLRRAGLMPARRYLASLGEELARLHQVPGRFVQSLEDASFDAWIKHYRPDESTPNTAVSYYLKGALVALALDLEIRHRTTGQRSLDDVMRLLWSRFGAASRGYEDSAVQALFEEATGLDLQTFFDDLVRGRAEVDLGPYLAPFGLELEGRWDDVPEPLYVEAPPPPPPPGTTPATPPSPPKPRPPAWLGVTTKSEHGRAVIATVHAEGPAERAGLAPGDEVVALENYKVDEKSLRERLTARVPGEEVSVTIFRREVLLDLAVTLGIRPYDRYEIRPRADADDAARVLYQAWLGEPFPAE
jgi:predicted metalloprotease with PDZ domain